MSTEQNVRDWTRLLTEPKAVLAPYHGKFPSPNSFAAHSFRCDFEWFALAGQFLELPSPPPSSWVHEGRARADALFEFLDVRRLEITGTLQPGAGNDSLHGSPIGKAGTFSLTEADDLYLTAVDRAPTRWKAFSYVSGGFRLMVEAGFVQVYPGRRAHAQYGWKSDA